MRKNKHFPSQINACTTPLETVWPHPNDYLHQRRRLHVQTCTAANKKYAYCRTQMSKSRQEPSASTPNNAQCVSGLSPEGLAKPVWGGGGGAVSCTTPHERCAFFNETEFLPSRAASGLRNLSTAPQEVQNNARPGALVCSSYSRFTRPSKIQYARQEMLAYMIRKPGLLHPCPSKQVGLEISRAA